MKYIGTQTYGLIKELTEDFEGTIRALHELGFNAIEPLVIYREKQEDEPHNKWSYELLQRAQAVMNELGMVIPSIHCDVNLNVAGTVEGLVEKILEVNQISGVKVFVTSSGVQSKEDAVETGAFLGKVASLLKENGCQLLLHNHENEMKPLEDGSWPMDHLLEAAGPDLMLEPDFGWAGFSADELEAAKKYKERVYYIHLKDFYPGYAKKGYNRQEIPDSAFSAVGEGEIKLKEVMETADAFCNCQGTLIIDQDAYAQGMLKALEMGMKNVNSWGVVIEE